MAESGSKLIHQMTFALMRVSVSRFTKCHAPKVTSCLAVPTFSLHSPHYPGQAELFAFLNLFLASFRPLSLSLSVCLSFVFGSAVAPVSPPFPYPLPTCPSSVQLSTCIKNCVKICVQQLRKKINKKEEEKLSHFSVGDFCFRKWTPCPATTSAPPPKSRQHIFLRVVSLLCPYSWLCLFVWLRLLWAKLVCVPVCV